MRGSDEGRDGRRGAAATRPSRGEVMPSLFALRVSSSLVSSSHSLLPSFLPSSLPLSLRLLACLLVVCLMLPTYPPFPGSHTLSFLLNLSFSHHFLPRSAFFLL